MKNSTLSSEVIFGWLWDLLGLFSCVCYLLSKAHPQVQFEPPLPLPCQDSLHSSPSCLATSQLQVSFSRAEVGPSS